MKEINFKELVGEKASLYLCTDANCFQLGSVKFEVVEDEQDGYRSSMDRVSILDANYKKIGAALAEVVICEGDIDDGYKLIDTNNGHKWLEFGTNNTDDYYPYFVFEWTPLTVIEQMDIKNKIK